MSNLSDRWLWVGYGVFMFCAVQGLRYAFQDMKDLTELEPEPQKKKPKPLEYSIDLKTLQTLISSPNLNISNAAISIVCQRAMEEIPGHEWLLKDEESPDPEIRRKARLASAFLRDVYYEEITRRHWNDNTSGHFGLDSGATTTTPESMPELIDPAEMEHLELDDNGRLDGWRSMARPSLTDEAESQRRRRRREAMVYHEGEGDVAEEDIFRRIGIEEHARNARNAR